MLGDELSCEVTDYMNQFRDFNQIPKGYEQRFRTYILGKDYIPVKGDYQDPEENKKYYFWWVRIPGYTCANIVFSRDDDTVKRILLTRRGGGYAETDQETMYVNPDKLEKDLNELFVGKKLNCYVNEEEVAEKEYK